MNVKIFLSYSSVDKKLAGNVKQHLEDFGFEVFLAHEDIEPSLEWQEVIMSELKTCDVFIPMLTEDFAMSQFTDQEVGFVLSRGIKILPLDAGVKPYGFIKKYQALPLDSSYIRGSCLDIAKSVAANSVFEVKILEGLVRTFSASNSFDEAARRSRNLLEFKDRLTPDHVNEILRVSASNDQIHKSFVAKRAVESLIASFRKEIKPSLIQKYRAKAKR